MRIVSNKIKYVLGKALFTKIKKKILYLQILFKWFHKKTLKSILNCFVYCKLNAVRQNIVSLETIIFEILQ